MKDMLEETFRDREISLVRTKMLTRFRAPRHFSGLKLSAQCEEDVETFDYLYSAKPLNHLLRDRGNIYIYGKPGNGKTHSALWLGRLILTYHLNRFKEDKRYSPTPIVFINAGEYVRRMKDSWDLGREAKEEFATLKRQVLNADVLILDDLGYESSYTQFVSDEISAIITSRYDDNKPIIFTSNRSPEEIEKYFRAAVVSRMFNSKTVTLHINGRDMR